MISASKSPCELKDITLSQDMKYLILYTFPSESQYLTKKVSAKNVKLKDITVGSQDIILKKKKCDIILSMMS